MHSLLTAFKWYEDEEEQTSHYHVRQEVTLLYANVAHESILKQGTVCAV